MKMKVIKRSGDAVEMLFDKVTKRIQKLTESPEFEPLNVQPDKVAQKVFTSMYDEFPLLKSTISRPRWPLA